MKILWTRSARIDRSEIFQFIEADSIRAACKMDDIFASKAALIAKFPQIGRPGRTPGTREFLAHRHYFLIYKVGRNHVQILRLLHTSRQWPPEKPEPL
jgi:plasmid stabilization system protein ParE